MRLAAIYDIHGNLPALEAVFRDIARANVDGIVVGGDVVAGPLPRETLTLLLSAPVPVQFLRGNADREVVVQARGQDAVAVPEHLRVITHWVAQQLRPEDIGLLSAWPATLSRSVIGLGEVLFCHATPRSDTDVFTKLTPEAQLVPVFEGLRAGVVVCGHTHMPFDRRVGPTRVINAGSVGMPYGEPGASWVLLGPGVEFRRTSYDLHRAAARIRRTSYPEAGAFADENVLLTPTEAEALEVFTRMEGEQRRAL